MPCLLLKDRALVKTVQFTNPKYIGDPINSVRIYNELEVDELVFLDIAATAEGKQPPFDVIEHIASECFMPFAYGGGIRNMEDIRQIFKVGAEKVVINSHAIENSEIVRLAAEEYGSQSILVSIDVKTDQMGNYLVCSHSGTRKTTFGPVEYAKKMEDVGAGEIFLNSIDRDGMMDGFDAALINMVSNAISIPLIACGGAGSYYDIGDAQRAGASAVAAGSIFVYQGKNRSVLINFPTQKELEEMLK
jgi:cyclase